MMSVSMYDYQLKAVENLHDGNILCGSVGSGKSRTALAYFYSENGGLLYDSNEVDGNKRKYTKMTNPQDLYIITTARKRDTHEWESELAPFLMSVDKNDIYPEQKIVIDSWNNIKKYVEVKDAFFIFDEQRVVGKGTWVKSFLKISRQNRWILLSATPGDTWSDYIPVFIANGFYRNRTEFNRQHCVFSRYTKYPKIERYVETGRLLRLRKKILVNMDYKHEITPHHEDIWTEYDPTEYKLVTKMRWNYIKDKPIETASELCYALRRVVNTDVSRLDEIQKIFAEKRKVIIFYNFDYELELLKDVNYLRYFDEDDKEGFELAEWNGHQHQPIPNSNKWVYLVQYNAGAEGWNCIKTDTIIFYSQNYSYKTMQQAAGRIDRLNTPFSDLYYYHLKSHAGIDLAIARALKQKKNFNENKFVKG